MKIVYYKLSTAFYNAEKTKTNRKAYLNHVEMLGIQLPANVKLEEIHEKPSKY